MIEQKLNQIGFQNSNGKKFQSSKFIIWAHLQGLKYNKYLISWFLFFSGLNCSASVRVQLLEAHDEQFHKVKMKMNQA